MQWRSVFPASQTRSKSHVNIFFPSFSTNRVQTRIFSCRITLRCGLIRRLGLTRILFFVLKSLVFLVSFTESISSLNYQPANNFWAIVRLLFVCFPLYITITVGINYSLFTRQKTSLLFPTKVMISSSLLPINIFNAFDGYNWDLECSDICFKLKPWYTHYWDF